MAKHFKEEPTTPMEPVPRTRLRAQPVNTAQPMPYGQAASYRTSYASPIMDDQTYYDMQPARGGIWMVLRGIVLLLAWAIRILALAAFVLVLANAIPVSWWQHVVTQFMDTLWGYVPWGQVTALAVDTPFGGTFCGDLALASLALFVLDWLLCKLRAAMR